LGTFKNEQSTLNIHRASIVERRDTGAFRNELLQIAHAGGFLVGSAVASLLLMEVNTQRRAGASPRRK
jgi:hypothetical protein